MNRMRFVLILLASICILQSKADHTSPTSPPHFQPSYDFIIVGAGDAGSIVANRLSAISSFNVLLLEAGKPSQRSVGGTDVAMASFTVDPVTGNYIEGIPFTRYDVPIEAGGLTTPQLGGLWNISGDPIQTAKLIGGSMVHNSFLCLHPSRGNVDGWNVSGWSYDEFLPFLKKLENASDTMWDFPGNDFVGFSGPIKLSNPAVTFPAELIFANACIEAGYPWNNNYFANLTGVGYRGLNINRGVRSSSAQEYLAPALGRPNLTVRPFSQVTKVLFNSQKVAIGVQYADLLHNPPRLINVTARKEVILSASAVLSPWILLNSGIGPAAQLAKYGIPLIVDNENVGQHMGNHLQVQMVFHNNVPYANFGNTAGAAIQYSVNGTGLYASSGVGTITLATETLPGLVDPDISLVVGFSSATNPFAQQISVNIGLPNPVYKNGTIVLQSSDPLVPPVYTANLIVNPADIQTAIRGVHVARKVFNTSIALANFGAEISPGPNFQTDAELEAWLLTPGVVNGYHHFRGTCKMGNDGDPLRVVDPNLNVVGVSNLRVIDSSIVPGQASQVMMLTVAGVGEKGAATVLATYGY